MAVSALNRTLSSHAASQELLRSWSAFPLANSSPGTDFCFALSHFAFLVQITASRVMANNKALQGLVPFSGLFKKTVSQRQTLLVDTANNAHDVKSPEKLDKLQANTASGVKTPAGLPASDSLKAMLSSGGLDVSVADHMIENCVGILGLPLGVAPTFVINNEHYVVPMVTEEPSVIGACNTTAGHL